MKRIALLALTAALAGCASSPDTGSTSSSSGAMQEKEYRVGSRIPVKDPAAASSSPSTTAGPSVLGPGTPPARVN